MLNGMPEEYSILSTVLSASDKELTLQDMLSRLLIVENKVSRPTAEGKAYVARPEGAPAARGQGRGSGPSRPAGKETRKCHNCGQPGHLKKDCWKRQREEQGSNEKPHGQRAQGASWRGTQGNVACTASLQGQGQAWLLDSGASSHIAMSQAGMSNLRRPAEANQYITFGNGAQAKVEAGYSRSLCRARGSNLSYGCEVVSLLLRSQTISQASLRDAAVKSPRPNAARHQKISESVRVAHNLKEYGSQLSRRSQPSQTACLCFLFASQKPPWNMPKHMQTHAKRNLS